jgi:hypothetical protein
METKTAEKTFRECGMMVTVAAQGTGKTHQNKILICHYVKDKLHSKVRGRKVLILDSNGEYASNTFGINGIPTLDVKRIAVKDVSDWCRSNLVECRRIDMKTLSIDEKLKILDYICQNARGCLLIMEDINTIILDMTHMKNIISSLVNLRHKAVDVIVSYQSLRAVEPRILSNCRYIRLHYAVGDSDDVKGKLSEPEVFKIAQLIINQKYFTGDKRFFLYVHTNPHKIDGNFNKTDFIEACVKYLAINKKKYKDEMEITKCTAEVAINNQAEHMYNQYYGNKK